MDKKLKYSIPSFDELVNKTASEIVAMFKESGLKFPNDEYKTRQLEKYGSISSIYIIGSEFMLCFDCDSTFSVHKKGDLANSIPIPLHNPIGPAVVHHHNSFIYEYYYIDNIEIREKDFIKRKITKRIKNL